MHDTPVPVKQREISQKNKSTMTLPLPVTCQSPEQGVDDHPKTLDVKLPGDRVVETRVDGTVTLWHTRDMKTSFPRRPSKAFGSEHGIFRKPDLTLATSDHNVPRPSQPPLPPPNISSNLPVSPLSLSISQNAPLLFIKWTTLSSPSGKAKLTSRSGKDVLSSSFVGSGINVFEC